MSLFIGLCKLGKNIKSWVINILKVLGRVFWLSNDMIKRPPTLVYTSFTSSAKKKCTPFSTSKVAGLPWGERLWFSILLFHLLQAWVGSVVVVWVPSSCWPTQGESLRRGPDPDKVASVVPTVQQGELLCPPQQQRWECEKATFMWTDVMTWTMWAQPYFLSSFLCLLFWLLTFLKNNICCFSIVKGRCFQYQK